MLISVCVPLDWSTCQLSANAVCGVGLKTRMLDCVRSDGKSVDLKYCEEVCAFVYRPFNFLYIQGLENITRASFPDGNSVQLFRGIHAVIL